MNAKSIIIGASILGLLSVTIGAFGAHGLESILTAHARVDTFDTAVNYQFYHTVALLCLGILMLHVQHKFLQYAAYAFIAGIVLFSGSLYVLSLTNITILGAITPFGGLAFMIGWLCLALGISKRL